ncbi:replication protein RepA [Isoptericola cucumis]|uniref:Plasmid encoded RepA protein n=1 Tax=Isoptericola cucumis TaxID=1776856 RepID=A0ABQ2BAQ8_9MICO|nr:replication protein RepA [Isoptericola cucumis]GGI10290.1 hypothetical protein GCM10007368_30500 [Isoptericola cucumis]
MRLQPAPTNRRRATAPGYYPAVFAEFMLPYRDPGPFARWQQQHDGRIATIDPTPSGSLMGGDLFPYGVLPRRLLAWMATTAVATGSRHLKAGSSRSEFARAIGQAIDGRSQHRLADQLARLAGATVHIQDSTARADGTAVKGTTFPIAEHYTFDSTRHGTWVANGDDTEIAITLSSGFFTSITSAPVPVDLHVLKLLGSSPLRTDLYLWSCRERQQRDDLRWHSTYREFTETFGSRSSRERRFHEQLRAAARAISHLHPDVTITPDADGLTFHFRRLR